MNNDESVLKELKILFVEDEVNISKLLKDALSDYFYSFTVASDGIEGLEKFKNINPDIVITDIMMPNLDGLEMTKEIRTINEDIPIIVLSAFSDKEKLLKAIDIGITKYFIKPFDPEEVLEQTN
jgi:DNA-binding response OmpR family regulator